MPQLETHIFQKLSYLNLDVFIGSVACEIMVTRILSVYPGPAWWIILPVSVWIIYAFDRQLDAYKHKPLTSSSRYQFHSKNAKFILPVILVLAVINMILAIFFLERKIIVFGFEMAGLILVYLLFIYFTPNRKVISSTKKIFIAVIYTAGIWGGPLSLLDFGLTASQWFIVLVFLILAYLDTIALTLYDEDSARDPADIQRIKKNGKMALIFFIVPILLIAVFLFSSFLGLGIETGHGTILACIIMLLMAIALAILFSFRDFFKKKDKYRILPEIVFWLPFLSVVI